MPLHFRLSSFGRGKGKGRRKGYVASAKVILPQGQHRGGGKKKEGGALAKIGSAVDFHREKEEVRRQYPSKFPSRQKGRRKKGERKGARVQVGGDRVRGIRSF